MTGHFAHSMPFGAALLEDGRVRFRLWAPDSARVGLELDGNAAGARALTMRAVDSGWHELAVPETAAGTRYRFIVQVPDLKTLAVPDPASRSNPDGVHEASAVVDPRAYAWNNSGWRGRPWSEAVVYELHVGSFTQEGTFAAARRQLPALRELGITVLQIMPLAAFPGRRNWGYDGVLQFAPAACYGGPDQLKALIDAAHSLGLMVMLDVVYNHFGPEGNYLHAYCPQFFNPAHRTPWGAAINFDGESNATVRDFFVHNALFWIEEYRFDGLRLDAVHAMRDTSSPDIVRAIARALREGPGRKRQVHLVLENNANQASYLDRGPQGEPIWATAQWNDDVHHALHVLTTAETDGYYADYAQAPLQKLGRALAEGFIYQGEHSQFRGAPRGQPSAGLPPTAFVGFLQNHDMVGNRAMGDRIGAVAGEQILAAAYVCLLLTPEIPMLFMGEEFAASTPFPYFCDFGPELAQSVSDGRRREFERFAAFAAEAAARIPDPNAEATFLSAKLAWDERERPPHAARLALVRELLALRRQHLVPLLAALRHGGYFSVEGSVLRAGWGTVAGSAWHLLAHFGVEALHASLPTGEVIFTLGVRDLTKSRVLLEPGAAAVTLVR